MGMSEGLLCPRKRSFKDVAAELVKLDLARDCERFSGGRYRALETANAQSLPFPGYCSP